MGKEHTKPSYARYTEDLVHTQESYDMMKRIAYQAGYFQCSCGLPSQVSADTLKDEFNDK